MEGQLNQKLFLWGVVLAWAPWVPMLIGLGQAFSGISNSKATGVAAIAGAFAETYLAVGLAATVICEAGAMFLLFRAFSRGDSVRRAFSVLSICASSLMIPLFCLSVWLFWFESHNRF